jgi:hypothetical protein
VLSRLELGTGQRPYSPSKTHSTTLSWAARTSTPASMLATKIAMSAPFYGFRISTRRIWPS